MNVGNVLEYLDKGLDTLEQVITYRIQAISNSGRVSNSNLWKAEQKGAFYLPNAFTPNNKDEEKNNVFSVSLENYNSYFIEIFDRWGNRVFTSENPKETWDGKAGSIVCTPDVYFYSIKINSITNHKYLYRGTITLIK